MSVQSSPELKVTRQHRPGPSFFAQVPNDKGTGPYQPFPMQKKIHYSKALYRVACLGRQVGKSELSAVEATFELTRNPGSKGWVVAPTFDQAEIIFKRTLKKTQHYVENHPHLKLRFKRGAKLEIVVEHYDRDHKAPGARLIGTSEFNGKSAAEPDNLVGATLSYLIIDEAAVVQEVAWTQALAPMLSTTQGWVLFVSTPRGFNWFYDLFTLGQSVDPEDIAYESFTAASWDANPTVPRAFYEKEKVKKPDLEFRQEYGAEFVSSSGSVFQGLDKLTPIGTDPALSKPDEGVLVARKPIRDRRYVIGADFGRLQDYTVYTVLDLDAQEVVATYRYAYVDWERQLERLKVLSDEWNGALVVGDNNGVGDYIQKEAGKLGIPFEGLKFTGSQVKSEVINHLAIGLEQGYLRLLDDPGLYKELRLFKYKRTESGQLVMKAEGRNHDDRVVSLALAYSKVSLASGVSRAELERITQGDLDTLAGAGFELPRTVQSGQFGAEFTDLGTGSLAGFSMFGDVNSSLSRY